MLLQLRRMELEDKTSSPPVFKHFFSKMFLPYCQYSGGLLHEITILQKHAGTYLQTHYGNGVFGNVYLSAVQH